MRRALVALAVVAMAAGGWVATPPPQPAPALDVAVPGPPRYAVCPGAEASRVLQTTLAVVTAAPTEGGVQAVAAGETLDQVPLEVGEDGGALANFPDLPALGALPWLLEVGTADFAAATVGVGERSLAASGCLAPTGATQLLPAGSTLEGEDLQLVLSNPFGVDAVASVTSSSEVGIDSASELESVTVPARSVITVDLAQLLARRETLAVQVETVRGRVAAALRRAGEGDVALLEGMEPASEWWLAVPAAPAANRSLMVATDSPLDVEYRVDVWGPEGLTEGYLSGVIPASTHVTVPLDELAGEPLGVRIVASAPVATALLARGEGLRAVTAATPQPGGRWLLAGPGTAPDASATVWVFNPGEQPAEVTLRPLGGGNPFSRSVEAGAVVGIQLSGTGTAGVLAVGSSDLVVGWSSQRGPALALASGVAFDAG